MLNEFMPLRGRQQADAVIVGGGLTGLMTADVLTEAGLRVILLDADQPGQGASALCAGTATLLCAPVYRQIARCHGLSAAQTHVDALQQALAELPGYLSPLAPYREAEAYVYAFLPRDLPELEKQLRLCRRLGLPAAIAPDAGGCPFPVERSMMLTEQLLTDAQGLIGGLLERITRHDGKVFGRSRVIGMEGSLTHTQGGCVCAPVTILAAGKPIGNAHRGILALLESRTMVQCRLEAAVPLHTLQQSVRPEGLSLRPIPGGVLATFCPGRSGTRAEEERIALFRRILKYRLADFSPGELHFRQELWPLDGLPVIGAMPGGQTLIAAGYSGHGVLGAYLAAQVLKRRILGRIAPSDTRYAPDRLLPASLLRQSQRRLKAMKAASRLHPRRPKCSLCRCHLHYCPEAERWACPVCGSAYGMLGTLLTGPAIQPARISALQRPDL